jgi:hypothetical protein
VNLIQLQNKKNGLVSYQNQFVAGLHCQKCNQKEEADVHKSNRKKKAKKGLDKKKKS